MTKPKQFVGLHAHTGFSTFDGLGSPEEHIDYAVENGMDAMAFTEHGNMASFPQATLHAKELRKKGINFKHIAGVEAYYHPDLAQWEREKFEYEESKKESKKHIAADVEESGAENEDETKNVSKWFNPINRRHHLVLLAKSNKGLENLFQLVSKSFKDGFYKFPRIDRKMLKEFGEDIVITTSCVGGPLAYSALTHFPGVPFDDLKPELMNDKSVFDSIMSKAENVCDELIDAVGRDNFFAELQFNKLAPQHLVNRSILELGKRGINLIAAADSHYCRPELWAEREIYKKLGRLNYDQINADLLPKDKSALKCELYPKNATQMWDAYKEYCGDYSFYDDAVVSKAIESTWHIAHDVIGNFELDSKMKLPSFVVPKGMTAFHALVEACKDGMRIRGLMGKPEYVQRLKHELKIIKDKEFAQYFLTMKAIIDIAHSSMLVGAGRGSGVGSLVNYVLGITQLDPIKYGLIFERFISPSRVDEPDVDSDVADRDSLVNQMKTSFGEENVIPITNFNTFQLKSLVKDISRLHGIPFEESNEVTKNLDDDVKHKANAAGENKSLFQLKYDDCMKHSERFRNFIEKYPHVGQHIKVLYKQQKTLGRHAGGVVVIEDASKHMPLIAVRKEIQTPWPEGMHIKSLSPFGIIKFDILGLETLRMIQRAIELILQRHEGISNPTWNDVNDWYQKHLSPDVIDEADPKVFNRVFKEKRFAGIFQFTAKHTQKFIHEFDPENVNDLAAATAIYRPGPLAAKVDKLYIEAKRDRSKIHYDHPAKKKVFEPTLGFCLFQEQLMQIAHELGGLSLDECDKLRKSILKRSVSGLSKNKSESEILEEKFIDGAEKNGYPRDKAKSFFDELAKWSSYGFNKTLYHYEMIDVFDESGKFIVPKKICDILPGEYVKSRDENTKEDIFIKVLDIHDHGELELVEIELDDGRKVRCTLDHKFRTKCNQMLPLHQILSENLELV
jgi:DNA polymerase-3 subunit alpha